MTPVTASTAPSSALPVLKWRWIAVTAAVVAVFMAGLLWLFLVWSGHPDAPVRIDAVKTAFGVGAGIGGVFALWLATRRQRVLELQLAETTRVAGVTERDLEERRVTELYTKAVEQLGNDKAPVRLGGLYALERLGQDNPKQRQTIGDVLCAYLRMPFEGLKTGLRGGRVGPIDVPTDHDEGVAPPGPAGACAGAAQDALAATANPATGRDVGRPAAGHARRLPVERLHGGGRGLQPREVPRRGPHPRHDLRAPGGVLRHAVHRARELRPDGFRGGRVLLLGELRRGCPLFTRTRSGGRFLFSHTVFEAEADFEGGRHEEIDLSEAEFGAATPGAVPATDGV